MDSNILHKAEALARLAHWDQTDKAGQPYIKHVARTAAAVAGDDLAETVAWLHDVIEDQPHFEKAMNAIFPLDVMHRVRLLTRWPGKTAEAYYADIKADPIALKVKMADLADNSIAERLAQLDELVAERLRKKYDSARQALA